MEALKIVFAGTPAFAADHLQALLTSPHQILAVYTQPDRAAGRGKQILASPVKQLALARGLTIIQPVSLKSADEQQRLADLRPDLVVVVAYGLILPQAVLAIPRYGCLNVHASLLPRWRGAAPIERALLAGDRQTGITIMQMDAGLDTGAMLHKSVVAIEDHDDRLSLENKLSTAGCASLLNVLANLRALQAQAETQDSKLSTYAEKLHKAEALIDWNQSADKLDRQIRAGIGRSPAYSFILGQRVRLLRAKIISSKPAAPPGTLLKADREGLQIACGNSILQVLEVQLPGKNPVAVADLMNSQNNLFVSGAVFSRDELSVDSHSRSPS